jgi:hypothetical protein
MIHPTSFISRMQKFCTQMLSDRPLTCCRIILIVLHDVLVRGQERFVVLHQWLVVVVLVGDGRLLRWRRLLLLLRGDGGGHGRRPCLLLAASGNVRHLLVAFFLVGRLGGSLSHRGRDARGRLSAGRDGACRQGGLRLGVTAAATAGRGRSAATARYG